MSEVIYRPVEGFPGYRVGGDGSVWSCMPGRHGKYGNRWRLLKTKPSPRYHLVYLYVVGGRGRTKSIHRLVLEAFVGPRPACMEARHLDGNPDNNSLSNLAWGTAKENAGDRIRHGRTTRGEANGMAELTEDAVRHIRHVIAAGASIKSTARALCVHARAVSHVAKRLTWKHVE